MIPYCMDIMKYGMGYFDTEEEREAFMDDQPIIRRDRGTPDSTTSEYNKTTNTGGGYQATRIQNGRRQVKLGGKWFNYTPGNAKIFAKEGRGTPEFYDPNTNKIVKGVDPNHGQRQFAYTKRDQDTGEFQVQHNGNWYTYNHTNKTILDSLGYGAPPLPAGTIGVDIHGKLIRPPTQYRDPNITSRIPEKPPEKPVHTPGDVLGDTPTQFGIAMPGGRGTPASRPPKEDIFSMDNVGDLMNPISTRPTRPVQRPPSRPTMDRPMDIPRPVQRPPSRPTMDIPRPQPKPKPKPKPNQNQQIINQLLGKPKPKPKPRKQITPRPQPKPKPKPKLQQTIKQFKRQIKKPSRSATPRQAYQFDQVGSLTAAKKKTPKKKSTKARFYGSAM